MTRRWCWRSRRRVSRRSRNVPPRRTSRSSCPSSNPTQHPDPPGPRRALVAPRRRRPVSRLTLTGACQATERRALPSDPDPAPGRVPGLGGRIPCPHPVARPVARPRREARRGRRGGGRRRRTRREGGGGVRGGAVRGGRGDRLSAVSQMAASVVSTDAVTGAVSDAGSTTVTVADADARATAPSWWVLTTKPGTLTDSLRTTRCAGRVRLIMPHRNSPRQKRGGQSSPPRLSRVTGTETGHLPRSGNGVRRPMSGRILRLAQNARRPSPGRDAPLCPAAPTSMDVATRQG